MVHTILMIMKSIKFMFSNTIKAGR